MNKELTAQLNGKYPKMFLFHNCRAANHFEFACGDGWYNILNAMFSSINSYVQYNNDKCWKLDDAQNLIDNGKKDDVPYYLLTQIEKINSGNGKFPIAMNFPVVDQIKEKFGTLRVYFSDCNDIINEITGFAETMSETTCEECGNIGKARGGGWIKTLCEEHDNNRQTKINERNLINEAKK